MDKDFFQQTNDYQFKALFCPASLIDALILLGKKEKHEIFPRSHKCEFRFNPNTYLTELHIRKNTLVRMAKRTYKGEKSTGLVLRDCLVPLIWGIQLASSFPQFAQNYSDIRSGMFALMTCYRDDKQVLTVLTNVIQCFPAK